MRRACRWLIGLYAQMYLVALVLFVVGAYGLFGGPRSPLAGVFLLPLGLPWNLWFDRFGEAARRWLAALSPAINLAILVAVCRVGAARHTKPQD